jgi:sec-independent protein translocase protein TatC
MPIILITLEAIELVQPRTLLHHWRWGIVITAVVAAVVTPSSDPFSMFALAVPLWVFYFVSIFAGVLIERRRRRSYVS